MEQTSGFPLQQQLTHLYSALLLPFVLWHLLYLSHLSAVPAHPPTLAISLIHPPGLQHKIPRL